ncbi:unnamed protein product [Didymodactylos carnosus]|uniref:Uncharacterized protein n=1 Tax=Didymodactylos carnosus TaxID=1234261 RepID=A0A814ID34_9BILA|nr:unnamed protein product [Didymodactylos carnosus]CAF1021684.1 unnamed protein product [Didymodactylos carnosus]CAF3586597.1 unnamed protein product [Didymodactylos carnosus]CAF3793102.1 unnamed protein product [Didymodactylos carnosus]
MDGIDEDYCDKLEFNECEKDEYRCSNGMCIPEEYWLDGGFDCMDWSDEMGGRFNSGEDCLYNPSVECDEHSCLYSYSCGDGHCFYDRRNRFTNEHNGDPLYCSNYRDLNYLCEIVSILEKSPHWTINGGYCMPYKLPFSRLGLDMTSNSNPCTFWIKCALTNGLDSDCPCPKGNLYCEALISTYCPEDIVYPAQGSVIAPYLIMKYIPEEKNVWYDANKIPPLLCFNGSIRCVGYQIYSDDIACFKFESDFISQLSIFEFNICIFEIADDNENTPIHRNYSSMILII